MVLTSDVPAATSESVSVIVPAPLSTEAPPMGEPNTVPSSDSSLTEVSNAASTSEAAPVETPQSASPSEILQTATPQTVRDDLPHFIDLRKNNSDDLLSFDVDGDGAADSLQWDQITDDDGYMHLEFFVNDSMVLLDYSNWVLVIVICDLLPNDGATDILVSTEGDFGSIGTSHLLFDGNNFETKLGYGGYIAEFSDEKVVFHDFINMLGTWYSSRIYTPKNGELVPTTEYYTNIESGVSDFTSEDILTIKMPLPVTKDGVQMYLAEGVRILPVAFVFDEYVDIVTESGEEYRIYMKYDNNGYGNMINGIREDDYFEGGVPFEG